MLVWEENILSIRKRDSDYGCLVGVKNILSVLDTDYVCLVENILTIVRVQNT